MSAGGDRGEPAALDGGEAGAVFAALVDAVLDVAPVVEMRDCTARLLDAIERRWGSEAGLSRSARPGPAVAPGPQAPPEYRGLAMARTAEGTQGSASPRHVGEPPRHRRRQATTQGRPDCAHRILPRSVLGIASLILAFAIGAGFSGVVLFSYYQYKLNQTNARVNTLVSGYKKQFANAEGDLSASGRRRQTNIQTQLKAIQQLQAGPATLAALVKQVAPSVFFVHTLDANGQASVGTAFVVSSNTTQSLLLTSYTTVKAATGAPGPAVFVRQGNVDTQVTVRSWDPQYDLALLVLPQRRACTPCRRRRRHPAPQPGDRIYAVSGLGSAGASIAQGSVIDVSASGIAEDAAIGPAFQGGPLINQAGQVVAVASRTYAPLGFTTDGVWFAPYVEAACNKVLDMPGRDARRQSLTATLADATWFLFPRRPPRVSWGGRHGRC